MIQQALKQLSKRVVKPCEWENEYTPPKTTHGDRKQYWTRNGSYNTELINRISEIKANKI